mmetsp:Transcript_3059/g.7177  ORF Transcript_3059/g.7177 Transcript_3059/m.7177 type:complete len:200 (-) Transcript_3059:1140-1739(-)
MHVLVRIEIPNTSHIGTLYFQAGIILFQKLLDCRKRKRLRTVGIVVVGGPKRRRRMQVSQGIKQGSGIIFITGIEQWKYSQSIRNGLGIGPHVVISAVIIAVHFVGLQQSRLNQRNGHEPNNPCRLCLDRVAIALCQELPSRLKTVGNFFINVCFSFLVFKCTVPDFGTVGSTGTECLTLLGCQFVMEYTTTPPLGPSS